MLQTKKIDSLRIQQYPDRRLLGNAAAAAVVNKLRQELNKKDTVNMIFAAAPSQNEFLAALTAVADIDWSRVSAFHMDEYIGLSQEAPQRFGNFLKARLFSKLPFQSVYYLDGTAADLQAECNRYTDLLRQYPVDIVCMGIGENTHIAFNDPHVADFNDPVMVKIVELDEACRQQQVNDGCFDHFDAVPTQALTLTIPALMAANSVFCMVPGENKAAAIRHTLRDDVSPRYPSTILRRHPQAYLFIDAASGAQLQAY